MLEHLDKCTRIRIVVLGSNDSELSSTYLTHGSHDEAELKFSIVRSHLFKAVSEINEELRNKQLIKDYLEYKDMERRFNALPQDVKDKLSALE